MFVLRRLPACFAVLLLGAHALRAGAPMLLTVPLTVLVLVLLFLPKRGLQIGLAALLALGSLVWIATLWTAAQARLALGQPWLRMAVILGAVALFTAWAAWLLRLKD